MDWTMVYAIGIAIAIIGALLVRRRSAIRAQQRAEIKRVTLRFRNLLAATKREDNYWEPLNFLATTFFCSSYYRGFWEMPDWLDHDFKALGITVAEWRKAAVAQLRRYAKDLLNFPKEGDIQTKDWPEQTFEGFYNWLKRINNILREYDGQEITFDDLKDVFPDTQNIRSWDDLRRFVRARWAMYLDDMLRCYPTEPPKGHPTPKLLVEMIIAARSEAGWTTDEEETATFRKQENAARRRMAAAILWDLRHGRPDFPDSREKVLTIREILDTNGDEPKAIGTTEEELEQLAGDMLEKQDDTP